jgi:DNA-binding transcriptional regulator YdaS (Cro superfamily)
MDLKTWVNLERGRIIFLAKRLEVPASFMSNMAAGIKSVPLERCVPIELATEGAVTRKDLRPDDWWKIWPELAAAQTDKAQSATENVARQDSRD